MPLRTPRPRGGLRWLAAAGMGAIALAAGAQTYRIPDLRPPPPRVAPAPPAGEPCNSCARILSIREVNLVQRLPAAGVAAVPGGEPGSLKDQNLIGAVISLPLGEKAGDRPYVGPAGTPEMYARMRETTYEITLQMDDGTYRFVRRADASAFGVGDRVRWLGGNELEFLVKN
jgi:outer membrane lipoprotein SlyB